MPLSDHKKREGIRPLYWLLLPSAINQSHTLLQVLGADRLSLLELQAAGADSHSSQGLPGTETTQLGRQPCPHAQHAQHLVHSCLQGPGWRPGTPAADNGHLTERKWQGLVQMLRSIDFAIPAQALLRTTVC